MKPLVIYHADCTDGFAAAFAAWLKLGDEAEYVPMQYGQVKSDYVELLALLPPNAAKSGRSIANRDVYILDFSFPREVMDYIFSNAKRVVWLDHHASSRTMAKDL